MIALEMESSIINHRISLVSDLLPATVGNQLSTSLRRSKSVRPEPVEGANGVKDILVEWLTN